jgi:riboflavin kinase / FMN adenylyltransferase
MSMLTTTLADPCAVRPVSNGRAVTIGAFDGVHLGHQAVLRLVSDLAHARDLTATVLTFDRHPAEIVRPAFAPKVLTTLPQKLELMAATRTVDECMILPFDEQRSHETAERFVEELLASCLHTRLVVVGTDFHFGFRRHGDITLLQRMGAELGFEALGLGLVASPDGSSAADGALPYSSTRVRALLAEGDVEGAAAILGRPHEIRGDLAREDGTDVLLVSSRICVPMPGLYCTDQGTARVRNDEAEPMRRVELRDGVDQSVRFISRAD